MWLDNSVVVLAAFTGIVRFLEKVWISLLAKTTTERCGMNWYMGQTKLPGGTP